MDPGRAVTTATLIGLGATGSRVADLLARMPGVSKLTLVDHDRYEESNLRAQAISRSDVGQPKVDAQSARISSINPSLEVQAKAARVENVPLLALRSSILVSCVDSRRARQSINRIAWRLRVPMIDTGVDSSGLVRVNAYVPESDKPCLECGWDFESYALLDAEYPCDMNGSAVPETDAPAEVGALAAALLTLELRRLTADGTANSTIVGSQLLWDTTARERHLTAFRRNEACLFDHSSWIIEASGLDVDHATLGDVFETAGSGPDGKLGLEGQVWITHLDCVSCGVRRNIGLHLYGRLSDRARTCGCGGRLFATGFFSFESITNNELSPTTRHRTLASVGLEPLDVVSITGAHGAVRHLQLVGRGIE